VEGDERFPGGAQESHCGTDVQMPLDSLVANLPPRKWSPQPGAPVLGHDSRLGADVVAVHWAADVSVAMTASTETRHEGAGLCGPPRSRCQARKRSCLPSLRRLEERARLNARPGTTGNQLSDKRANV
jgi:hypothetical protein